MKPGFLVFNYTFYMPYTDHTAAEINEIMNNAWQAFHTYRKMSLKARSHFMRAIALEIENCGEPLIQIAMRETSLPAARLRTERTRTIFQLNSYADFCESGQWLDVRIDTADLNRTPPKPDIRKMLVPLGPVVVFGAGNFPFAYSTAGGDTACAFAAGCPVIVKAHPAHADTGEMVAGAIKKAVATFNMPEGIFSHVHGASAVVGEALIKHPYIKAVGFTGSFAGGKQLFDWGNQRKEPIPVFCEMGSVNPVFLLPEKIKMAPAETARSYAASITLSVGQFCTNPGIIIGIDNDDLDAFINVLKDEIKNVAPAAMLNSGIYKNYIEKREKALAQEEVRNITEDINYLLPRPQAADREAGIPTITTTTATNFIKNPLLQQEVFGPYSIIVRCADMNEMLQVARSLEGQLTATLMATENDVINNQPLLESVKNICGRIIMNGVPTGVEVGLAMQHGGPFPATTDSRFTSVGADGIKRFARPMAFQNWPDSLLPEELKNENQMGIWRIVDNKGSWEL